MPANTSKTARLRVVPNLPEKEDLYRTQDGEVCDICYGTGVETVPGKGARTCSCRQRDSHSGFLDRAKLPRRYAECHFHNYKPQNPTQERAFKFDALAEIAEKIGDRGAAGFVEQALRGPGAEGIRDLGIAAAQLAERP